MKRCFRRYDIVTSQTGNYICICVSCFQKMECPGLIGLALWFQATYSFSHSTFSWSIKCTSSIRRDKTYVYECITGYKKRKDGNATGADRSAESQGERTQ